LVQVSLSVNKKPTYLLLCPVYLVKWRGEDVAVKRVVGQQSVRKRSISNCIPPVSLSGIYISFYFFYSVLIPRPFFIQVKLFGVCREEFLLAMEYMGSGNLADFIGVVGQLSLAEVKSVALDVIRGLIDMHKTGIIHRDIKLSNILITLKDGAYHAKIGGKRVHNFACSLKYLLYHLFTVF